MMLLTASQDSETAAASTKGKNKYGRRMKKYGRNINRNIAAGANVPPEAGFTRAKSQYINIVEIPTRIIETIGAIRIQIGNKVKVFFDSIFGAVSWFLSINLLYSLGKPAQTLKIQ